jgi:hypothetical protein
MALAAMQALLKVFLKGVVKGIADEGQKKGYQRKDRQNGQSLLHPFTPEKRGG